MNHSTKMQVGSKSRDMFKWLHKQLLGSNAWALDVDLELVEKEPIPFIVARLDFKVENDQISFSESISYQHIMNTPKPWTVPVYIIYANTDFKQDAKNEDLTPKDRIQKARDTHRFTIKRLVSANYRPHPPKTVEEEIIKNGTWDDVERWQNELRDLRKKEQCDWIDNHH